MNNSTTLEHLLEVEAKASSLVEDAQTEAQKRLHENEERNHAAFVEQYRAQIQERHDQFNKEREKIINQYQKELDDYRREISGINVNNEKFTGLINNLIDQEN